MTEGRSPEHPPDRTPRKRTVRDREVVLVSAAVVVGVLAVLALSVWVRPFGDLLALAPVLIVVLVVVTVVVLVRAITARGS